MTGPWLVLVESNTTGSGRAFCARARDLGLRPVLLARDPGRYPYAARDGVGAAAGYGLDTDPGERALPPQPAVLVEESLPGEEYSGECLGDQVIGITRKHLGPEPYFVETGHDFPAPLPAACEAAIGGAAIAALRALGLGWRGAPAEVRHTPRGAPSAAGNPPPAGGAAAPGDAEAHDP